MQNRNIWCRPPLTRRVRIELQSPLPIVYLRSRMPVKYLLWKKVRFVLSPNPKLLVLVFIFLSKKLYPLQRRPWHRIDEMFFRFPKIRPKHSLFSGLVEEQGTHEELLEKKGIYYELVSLQRINRRDAFVPEGTTAENSFSTANGVASDKKMTMKRQQSVKSEGAKGKESLEAKLRELKEEEAESPTFFRMMRENGPEYKWILSGTVGSVVLGAAMPAFSLLYSQMFQEFSRTGEELRKAGIFWSCIYLVLGGKLSAEINCIRGEACYKKGWLLIVILR